MSISTKKSLNTSILKSSISRTESLQKSKVLRFALDTSSVKEILRELETNPDVKSYQNLIYKLTDSRLEEDELRKIILDSIESVSIIDKNHILLVQTLLDIRWISKGQEIVECYHKLLLRLMTHRTEFLVLCLSKIFKTFIPTEEEYENAQNDKSLEIERNQKLQLVHKLIEKTLDTIPMIKLSFRKIISSEFPYFKQPHYEITSYISNLLKILDYCPCLTHDILELILENILLIDVNTSKDQIDQYEEEEKEDDEDNLKSDAELSPDTMKLPIAETLDRCMNLIFDYLSDKFKSRIPSTDQDAIITTIFDYFEDHMLKTITKHCHFFLFYLANLSDKFQRKFLEFLWEKVCNKNQSATIRQTAVGYLCSFLSRAKYLDLEVIKSYLRRLTNWTHEYLKNYNEKNSNPKSHVVFYSICQAIFYIISFRNRDLTRKSSNLEFLIQLNLYPIVKHPLNPLYVCIPAIVTVFDNVTSKHQILMCHSIIVNNASKCLTTVYSNDQHRPEEILDSIFPFDPYLLKKSGKRITPLYVEYQETEEESNNEENYTRYSQSSQKRVRNISLHECEDFIIFENKKLKLE